MLVVAAVALAGCPTTREVASTSPIEVVQSTPDRVVVRYLSRYADMTASMQKANEACAKFGKVVEPIDNATIQARPYKGGYRVEHANDCVPADRVRSRSMADAATQAKIDSLITRLANKDKCEDVYRARMTVGKKRGDTWQEDWIYIVCGRSRRYGVTHDAAGKFTVCQDRPGKVYECTRSDGSTMQFKRG